MRRGVWPEGAIFVGGGGGGGSSSSIEAGCFVGARGGGFSRDPNLFIRGE